MQDNDDSDFNTGHPLLKNTSQIADIAKRLASRDKAEDFKIKEIEEWKLSLNRLAATPDGQVFLKAMISFSDLFTPGDIRDTVKMVVDKSKAAFYLKWVRPYLDSTLRKEIE